MTPVDRFRLYLLKAQIKRIPTRRKYQRAFIKLVEVLAVHYIPIGYMHNEEGEMGLYWDTDSCYCDIEANPSACSFSVYIRQRGNKPNFAADKEWYFESVMIEEFGQAKMLEMLTGFRKTK